MAADGRGGVAGAVESAHRRDPRFVVELRRADGVGKRHHLVHDRPAEHLSRRARRGAHVVGADWDDVDVRLGRKPRRRLGRERVVAGEIDADGGDLGGVVCTRELRFAALQGLAEEVLRVVDRGREFDDEARLLHRRLILALKRLAMARDFGNREDVVLPVLPELAPPRLVAGGVRLDAEELVTEREPLLRLVWVVDAETRLQNRPVRLHLVHDVVESAVRGRAVDRDALLAERARRNDVREELLAGLRVGGEEASLVVIDLRELPHVALGGVEGGGVLRERDVALHAVVHVEVALLGRVVRDLLAPERALLLDQTIV